MTGNKKYIPISKLPRLLQRDMTAVVCKKPTRLELMKEEFHRKLLREKERKIIEMYELNQIKTIERPHYNNRPTGIPMKKKPLGGINKEESPVRKFFREGRELNEGKSMAAIQAHYRRPVKVSVPRRSSAPMIEKHLIKRSAGRDRDNLLPPIIKKNTNEDLKNVQRKTNNSAQNEQNNYHKKSYSAPSGKQKSDNVDSYENDELSSDSSSPDMAGLETLKRKNSLGSNDAERRNSLGSNTGSNGNDERQFIGVPVEEIEGLSDFHKWKLEQMRVKEEKFYKKALKTKSSESDNGLKEEVEERLLMKQNELLAELAERQRELDKMQEQRLEKERREAEELEKRVAIEREKSAKLEREREETARRDKERKKAQEKREAERQAREEQVRRAKALAEKEAEEEDQENYQQQFVPHPPAKPRAHVRRPPKTISPPAETFEEIEKIDGPDVDFYIQAAAEASQNDSGSFNLSECRICGRRFAAERLKKHESCCKSANKKRKVFDPVKMRLEGTEAVKFQGISEKAPPKKKKDWRKQHEEFKQSIRYAKKVQEIEKNGGDIRQITPPPPAENPDYVQCPHCERRFNSTAAERHIPRCQNIKGKPLRMR